VTDLSIPLTSIKGAFQGVIPTPVATASRAGVPHCTYLSIVWFVDDERIALSNQFLGTTAANLHDNHAATLRVIDASTMIEYEIEASFLRSENSGETFEAMQAQLEAIAAQSGMEDTFRLRGIEILRVDRCETVVEGTNDNSTATPDSPPDLLAALDAFVRRLAACRDLAEATRVALQSLEDLFELRHSMLLMADGDAESLYVLDTNGYPDSGVGAEVPLGEGLIGVAARRRQQVQVANAKRDRTLAAATRSPDADSAQDIVLPGLTGAQSMAATPLLLHHRLIGVLYVESEKPGRFDTDTGRLIEIVAGHMAVTIALLSDAEPDAPVSVARTDRETPRPDSVAVAFHDHDGSILVDGRYVIRGVPGRILYSMLDKYGRSGRTSFTNREIRLDRSIGLPAGNDNLEARLLTLRRRLAESGNPFRLDRTGRGQLELTVGAEIDLVRHDNSPPHAS